MDQIAEIAKTSKPALYRFTSRIKPDSMVQLPSASIPLHRPPQRVDRRHQGSTHAAPSTHFRVPHHVGSGPRDHRFLEYQTLLEGRAVEYPSKTDPSARDHRTLQMFQVRQNLPTTPPLMAGLFPHADHSGPMDHVRRARRACNPRSAGSRSHRALVVWGRGARTLTGCHQPSSGSMHPD